MKPIKLNPDIKGFKDTERGKQMKPRTYEIRICPKCKKMRDCQLCYKCGEVRTDLTVVISQKDVIQMINELDKLFRKLIKFREIGIKKQYKLRPDYPLEKIIEDEKCLDDIKHCHEWLPKVFKPLKEGK